MASSLANVIASTRSSFINYHSIKMNQPAGRGGGLPLLPTSRISIHHMLFFAGSGGYKTTSNVVPTALRYTGPIISTLIRQLK